MKQNTCLLCEFVLLGKQRRCQRTGNVVKAGEGKACQHYKSNPHLDNTSWADTLPKPRNPNFLGKLPVRGTRVPVRRG